MRYVFPKGKIHCCLQLQCQPWPVLEKPDEHLLLERCSAFLSLQLSSGYYFLCSNLIWGKSFKVPQVVRKEVKCTFFHSSDKLLTINW